MIRFGLILLLLAAGLLGLVVCGLVVGAFLDPTGGYWAVIASSVWAPFGPFLGLVAGLVCGLGLAAWRGGWRRAGGVVGLIGVAGIIGSAVIVGRIIWAGVGAGASVDLGQTLLPGPMDAPAPDVVEVFRTVDGTDLRAAVYLPPDTVRDAPILLYVHGGGFMTGSFTETAADLRWFADRGWLVVSVEYRLFAPGRPTWDLAPKDVACALVWISGNAARFGGDAMRIALAGDSAGGNLAVNVGYAAASGRPPAACGRAVPVPMAIAVLYPAVDPLSIYEQGFPVPGFEPRMLIEGYIGGPPERLPARMAAVTSASYLTAEAPPTLVVLPEKDSLVVAAGTVRFAEAARRAGVDLTLVRIPFANHVFNQIAAGSLGNQIGRTLRLRFLEQHAP